MVPTAKCTPILTRIVGRRRVYPTHWENKAARQRCRILRLSLHRPQKARWTARQGIGTPLAGLFVLQYNPRDMQHGGYIAIKSLIRQFYLDPSPNIVHEQ
jgi:hypothetical protein